MKIVFKLCFILLASFAYSQDNDRQRENFSPRAYWGFSLVPVCFKKGQIDGDVNKYNLRSSSQLGGEVLVNYYYNFEPNYSLVLSAGGELLVHNFNYEIPKTLFDSMGGRSVTFNPVGPLKMSSGYLKVQAELQSKLHRYQDKNWFGAIGLSLLYPIQGADEYAAAILWGSNSQSAQEYVLIQFQNNSHKPSLNFHITGGHEWVLHTGHFLQAALKFNYSPVNMASATYAFTVGHEPPLNGRYAISSSGIGLSVAYVFAKMQRH